MKHVRRPGQPGTIERPPASVSVDLDNIWSYLKTHGDPEWESRPSHLASAVPRIVDLLADVGVRSTVFVIGADAERDDGAEAVTTFHAAGHEIGNHTFEHEPWPQHFTRTRLVAEIDRTDAAIVATGVPAPVGFRGPGFALTAELLDLLAARGYRYDASTLPTWIGPLARFEHFRTSDFTESEKLLRDNLFGGVGDATRSLHPYLWDTPSGRVVELPVTTMPLTRIPIHGSYLMQLYAISPRLARTYLTLAVGLCRRRGVAMSMLVHPTDVMDRRDIPQLAFFPGMSVPAAAKVAFMTWVLRTIGRHFDLMGTGAFVDRSAVGAGRVVSAAGLRG
ncbi:polysaccharide deacetylase family protein [Gordonia sp. NPDC003376]